MKKYPWERTEDGNWKLVISKCTRIETVRHSQGFDTDLYLDTSLS